MVWEQYFVSCVYQRLHSFYSCDRKRCILKRLYFFTLLRFSLLWRIFIVPWESIHLKKYKEVKYVCFLSVIKYIYLNLLLLFFVWR